MKVVLLPQAEEDLDAVYDPLFSEVVHRLETLKEFPELGAPLSGPFSGYRGTAAGSFRIVYQLLPHGIIEVAYIRDCGRKPLS